MDGRPGVPLYVCVDFAEHVDVGSRAGLEAALGAAGILDARVTPDEEPVERSTLAAVAPATPRHRVDARRRAHPLPVDGLDAERIAAVLRAVPIASDVVTIHTDGTWRLGPLAGRFVQSQPEFVGHAARERRRAERLAALDATSTPRRPFLPDSPSATIGCRPPAPRSASHVVRRAFGDRARVRALRAPQLGRSARRTPRAHASAKADAEAKLRVADDASIELQRAATRTRLPADLDALTEVEELLRDCDGHRRTVTSARRTLTIASEASQRAADTARTMLDRADRDRTAADRADVFARSEHSRYEQLRANVGGDAERAVEALARARGLRQEHESIARRACRRPAQRRRHAGHADGTDRRLRSARRIVLDGDLTAAKRHFEVVCSAEIADILVVERVEPGADPVAAARRLLAATEPLADDVINRMERSYREILLDGLRAGHDPSMPKIDGIDVVRVGTVDGDLPIGFLARQLRDEYERTGQLLTKQEREIFETHLLTRVGDALRQLLLDADAFEHRINAEMSKVPTESGMIVELAWETTGDEPGLREAIGALRTTPELLGPDRRDTLREFFMQRIADVRAEGPGQSFVETLTAVLDYRSWHRFALYARFSTGKRQRVTRTFYRDLSGGEAATLLHLPLFAAAAAQYGNGAIRGPRIIALDEAFVGIDDTMRSRLMGLLTQLDLDVILTSHEFWGFYETVPSLVLYDLVRRPPTPGVYAQRLDWASDASPPTR